jgi:apolipoprotein N-acyltransferase
MLGYVLATFLSFPHPLPFAEGAVLDLGVVVSFAAPLCLVMGLSGQGVRKAAGNAFRWTVLAHGLVLHFIYVVTVVYGHAPAVVGIVAPFALALYAALIAALFGAGWAWLGSLSDGGDGPFANAWTAALLWTALDHFRGFFLTGWPWATLGYAQHLNPALMGLPQWTSVYGLSFVVVLGGVALARVLQARAAGTRVPRSALAGLAAVVAFHVLGLGIRIEPGVDDEMQADTVRVAVVQGNIDQGVKWNAGEVLRTLQVYEDLSREAAEQGARIIAWPETAVPGALELDPELRRRIASLSRETGAVLVVGGVGIDRDASGRIAAFYDSAFFVDPVRGFLADRYDKSHLVPFGEYVPLRGLLGGLLGAVASGIATGDVTPGNAPRAVDLALSDGSRSVRVAVPICYELLFPHLVRRFVADGAGLLIGITNDAWYGRTGAPYQFLAITAMRSAETGVYGVRAANTGVSGLIDSGGWVRQATPIFERDYRVFDVPVRRPADEPGSGGTFYVRHGDVFAAGCWLALAGTGLLGLRARRRDPHQGW